MERAPVLLMYIEPDPGVVVRAVVEVLGLLDKACLQVFPARAAGARPLMSRMTKNMAYCIVE